MLIKDGRSSAVTWEEQEDEPLLAHVYPYDEHDNT
jgi:hypothetical protein